MNAGFSVAKLGIRGKLLLLLALVLAVGAITFVWLQNRSTEYRFETFLRQEVDRNTPTPNPVASRLAHVYEGGGWQAVQRALADHQLPERPALLLVMGNNGERYWSPETIEVTAAKIEGDSLHVRLSDSNSGNRWMLMESMQNAAPVIVGGVTVGQVMWLPLPRDSLSRPQQEFLSATRSTAMLLLAIFIPAGLVIVFFVGRQITRPLRDLADASERVGTGELGYQVAISGDDEVGQLASRFNDMSSRLARTELLRKRMVSDVAHELRTPLTGLRCSLEAVRDDVSELTSELVENLFNDVLQLQNLVADLQELSLAESRELTLNMVPTELQEVLNSAIRAVPFRNHRVRCTLSSEEFPEITTDPMRLRQVLVNVLQNALTHSPENGQVGINVSADGELIRILIRDYGSGVSATELENIFDRFYRTSQARARSQGGSGLGLAITRELTHLLGGEIVATIPDDGGMQFEISLPL